jgi:hypothetical protein
MDATSKTYSHSGSPISERGAGGRNNGLSVLNYTPFIAQSCNCSKVAGQQDFRIVLQPIGISSASYLMVHPGIYQHEQHPESHRVRHQFLHWPFEDLQEGVPLS